jgi:gamma-carbonic anhydrase
MEKRQLDASGIVRIKMSKIIQFKGKIPSVHPTVFIADGAKIIGDVEIQSDSSVWFNAVIRGDVNYIKIGSRTNIQDNSVLHVTSQTAPLNIGSDVTIGHNVTMHGCTINDRCLIGMGTIILDGSIVNSDSMIAAGSLLLEKFIVPEGVLVAGRPAQVKRELTQEEIKYLSQTAVNYVGYSRSYRP